MDKTQALLARVSLVLDLPGRYHHPDREAGQEETAPSTLVLVRRGWGTCALLALNPEGNIKDSGHLHSAMWGAFNGELTNSEEVPYVSLSLCFLLHLVGLGGTYPKDNNQG